jgi:C-terminal binding protein
VLVFRSLIPAHLINKMTKCRMLVRYGVGVDRIDKPAADARQIAVCNTPDYGTFEVADHAIALTMALRRGLVGFHDRLRDMPVGHWTYNTEPTIRRLGVQTFGVLGCGRIGTATALRAKALGFRVTFYDPYLPNGMERALGLDRVKNLQELGEQSDVLSLHTPLTPETQGMVDAKVINALPKGAIVVNTARGPVLDYDALEAGLRSGHLSGAGLDVLPVEPPVEPIHPLFAAYRAREPWQVGRLIITPHSAFYSPESWEDMRALPMETVKRFLVDGTVMNRFTLT